MTFNNRYPSSISPSNSTATTISDDIIGPNHAVAICQIYNSLGQYAIQCLELYHYYVSQELPKSPVAMSLSDVPTVDTFMALVASSHMVYSKRILLYHSKYTCPDKVVLGNGLLATTKNKNSMTIPTLKSPLLLKDVLHVPSLVYNLVFIHKLLSPIIDMLFLLN